MSDILNCLRKISQGFSGFQNTVLHHHERHEEGGADVMYSLLMRLKGYDYDGGEHQFVAVDPETKALLFKGAIGGNGVTDHGELSGLLDDDHTQYLLKSGGVLTGLLTLSSAPTMDLHASTKKYVDDHIGGNGGVIGILFNLGFAYVDTKQAQALIPGSYTIIKVKIYADTAPTGASLIVDVNKNGTTIFTTQANRPEIAISGHSDDSGTPDVTAIAAGDRLSIDVDQVGSTIAGGNDLLVAIVCQ